MKLNPPKHLRFTFTTMYIRFLQKLLTQCVYRLGNVAFMIEHKPEQKNNIRVAMDDLWLYLGVR